MRLAGITDVVVSLAVITGVLVDTTCRVEGPFTLTIGRATPSARGIAAEQTA